MHIGSQTKTYQRKKENFVCKKCKQFVRGNGYTNHCPYCLWSRHIDINPGDRRERCKGMMEPIKVEVVGGEYKIIHRCVSCGAVRKNKASFEDNMDILILLSSC